MKKADEYNNIVEIHDNCYGCSACMNICPNNAIDMQKNEEGFSYPKINQNCTNCGLCLNVCPHLHANFNNNTNPDCYAYMADNTIRRHSSSGGVFPVLAKYFIDNNGYVAGAVWKSDASVSHIISNRMVDIEKMRNSKYLQSNINYSYKEAKQILDDDKLVLFTGTPCQIAGLKSYLNKDYKNLYTIDIICHGVPSPMVFKKYISENFSGENERWLNTNFRDKVNGWRPELTNTTTATTTATTTISATDDLYMRAFLSNICLRNTCTDCQFQTIPRQGDITIGDFWGIWSYNKKLNDENGTSVVLNNNNKGSFLINILKENAKIFKPVPLKYAVNGNPCLIRSVQANNNRKLFFELLGKKTLKETVASCLDDKVDYLIVNFWDAQYNYGALLTAYAMQELIKSYGFTCKLLNSGYRTNTEWYKNSYMEDFSKKFLNITRPLSFKGCFELSKSLKGVILGSDQILRAEYMSFNFNKYLLNWVDNSVKKIALSASFGLNKEEFLLSPNHKSYIEKLMKSALSSFDYISCRERSGKEIFKDIFDLESDYIIDPVFLIDKHLYDNIIKLSNIDSSDKIVSYVLDNNDEYNKLYEYLSKKENASVASIDIESWPVQDWLKSIRDCRLLITDSFHGVCFALILNKPFICIRNKSRGDARFQSLIDEFNIQKNFVYSIDEIYKKDFDFNIDAISINKTINQKMCADSAIINDVLNNNYSNNPSAKENKIKNSKYLKSLEKKYFLKILKLKFKYQKCRFLANITKGKKKEHYINKKFDLRQKIKWKFIKW